MILGPNEVLNIKLADKQIEQNNIINYLMLFENQQNFD